MEQIHWWWLKFGESEIWRVTQAIQRGQISQGRITAEFESTFAAMLNVKHAMKGSGQIKKKK